MAYPVNQTVDYSGMSVNVNTDVPLLIVSDVTTGAPYGSHAIKMQSFMLSDIINPTVYDMAASSIDPTLTTSVFPTILSTGAVNIDQFLPMISNFTEEEEGDTPSLISLFSDVDLNTLFEGGIPLNGEVPGQLTGYYKYTSAVGGDNGGIMMLGSKFNPATQRREMVGYGFTTDLTDTVNYSSFSVAYTPLSEIDESYTYVEADSMVILLMSSANTTPQQGSALYLDRLQLWTAGSPVIEDTCSAVFDLTVTNVDTMHAALSWSYEGDPVRFEAEYGPQGFAHGEGMQATVNSNSLSLSGLTPDTDYDVYVRCMCGAALWGDWSMTTFHTDTLPVVIEDTTGLDDTTGIKTYATDYLHIYPNPAQGKCTVQFEEMPVVVRLYALNGSLLMEAVPVKETMELTLPTSGVFLLVCEMKEGTVIRKIVNQGR